MYRIGFFGDSYTEARQVPLDSTFPRVVERGLKNYNVETLAFGVMAIGTLHEYLLHTRDTEGFNLDMVVYVFYENDPRDNLKALERNPPPIPYAILRPNGDMSIDNSFRRRGHFRQTW